MKSKFANISIALDFFKIHNKISSLVLLTFFSLFLFIFICINNHALAVEEQFIEYRVNKKDCLIKIGERILTDPSKWSEIAKINRLKDPYIIRPEQVLFVPIRLLKGSPMDGTVTFLKGETFVKRGDDKQWERLKLGDRISKGDTLKTEDKSTLEILFEDKSILFMRPNTLLTIDNSEKKGVFAIVKSINLKAGKAISNIKSATGTESRHEVITPSAIASARGTEFRVSIDEKMTTRSEVVDGKIFVYAQNVQVEVKKGEGTVVELGAKPIKPVPLARPPKLIDIKPIYKDIPLVFSFEPEEGTKAIRAVLTKDKDGKDIIFEDTVKTGERFIISNLDDGLYYLIISGIDALGLEGEQQETITIKFRANPLPPFIQIKDEDLEFVGKSAEFSWLKVKDAVSYHIQIARDEKFENMVEEKKDYKDLKYKTGIMEYGQYYFRICSQASDGYEGGWSNTVRFKLIPPPPVPPMEKPSIDKDSIFLKWRHMGEGITYHFQMASDESFKEIIMDKKLDKSEITLKRPKEPGIYYVRTSSIDKKGREGSFSLPQSFEIERGFPYKALGIIMGLGALSLMLF